jgi:hypothetical protein
MSRAQWTSAEWFEEAARCYLEGHQACAWCLAPHQVFRSVAHGRVEYQCNHCDFHVSHDMQADRFLIVPGEKSRAAPGAATMHDLKTVEPGSQPEHSGSRDG